MEIISIILGAGITIFSLNLLLISLFSYRKYRNVKLLLMSAVFLFFFLKGLLLSLSIFSSQIEEGSTVLSIWVLDLVILILLYITSLKR